MQNQTTATPPVHARTEEAGPLSGGQAFAAAARFIAGMTCKPGDWTAQLEPWADEEKLTPGAREQVRQVVLLAQVVGAVK